jgi:hypothetical protein
MSAVSSRLYALRQALRQDKTAIETRQMLRQRMNDSGLLFKKLTVKTEWYYVLRQPDAGNFPKRLSV